MNQFILGGGDPVLAGTQIDEQIQLLEGQKQLLMARQRQMQQGAIVQQQQQLGQQSQVAQVSLWDSIDAEVEPLTNEQRQLLLSNEEYVNNYNALQNMVQVEVLNLVRAKIENSEEGRNLLTTQLKLVKSLKTGFRRNSRRDEEYREDDDRHIMRILGYGYDGDDDRHRSRKHRRDHDEHFDEREAYDTVEEMYHVKGDKKYVGEKFDMDKAHKVYEKLRDADGYTIGDIYVAINAQYHDYCELFEKWFGSNFDEKIIASAVDFWFEDDDFDGNKVWKYFNEM